MDGKGNSCPPWFISSQMSPLMTCLKSLNGRICMGVGGCLISYNLQLACVRKLEVIWLNMCALPRRSLKMALWWLVNLWVPYLGIELVGQQKRDNHVMFIVPVDVAVQQVRCRLGLLRFISTLFVFQREISTWGAGRGWWGSWEPWRWWGSRSCSDDDEDNKVAVRKRNWQ